MLVKLAIAMIVQAISYTMVGKTYQLKTII